MVKYITWGLSWDPFKGYLKQSENFKIVQNMDIDLNSNGNSKQVRNLTVLIGSDPFLPQPDSPTVEPDVISVDEKFAYPTTTLSYSRVLTRKSHQPPPIHT